MKRRELFRGASALAVGAAAGAGFVASPSRASRAAARSAAEFGAVGDGRTDDTDALQAALDAVVAGSNPGILTIPPGIYRVSRTLRIDLDRKRIGTITRFAGISAYGAQIRSSIRDGSDVLSIDSRTVARFLLIEGLEIRGRGAEGAGLALHCDGRGHYIYNSSIRDVMVEGCGGDGCRMVGNIFESQIFNAYFRDNGGNGMTMGHAKGGGILSAIHVFGCVFGGNKGHGAILIRKANDVSFHGCYFLLNGSFGLVAGNGCTLLSHCGFENNHQGKKSAATGNAGLSINVFGTLIGCTAYSIFKQKHLVRGYITNHLVMIGCTAAGDRQAKGATLARLRGKDSAKITVIGCRGAIEDAGGPEPLEIGQTGFGARFGAGWNSPNQVRLGDYRLWVDGNGDLRMKQGAPNDDTDGRKIGA
ncbi:MAG: hypothetical protein GEU92_06265 [Alphaproteobacteria bacterium]|nr:hypothetical protein [Alphaproteobacteria bacterium]